MRFVLLMAEEGHFDKWDAADEATRRRVVADFEAFDAAVAARGSVVGGEALSRPDAARTVRPGPDRPVTEGPFAETVELAALLPQEYTVEVRPVPEVAI